MRIFSTQLSKAITAVALAGAMSVMILTGCGGTPSSSSSSTASSSKPTSSSSSSSSQSSSSKPTSSSQPTSSTPTSSTPTSSSTIAKSVIWTTSTDRDGVTSIVGYDASGTTPSGGIIIPTTLGGKKITKIGFEALHDNKYITSVTIPGSIATIDGSAFAGCTSLKTVIIGEGVTTIGHNAFYNCTSLENVSLPESLITISDSHAFANCTSLKQIKLPSKIKIITYATFSGCTALEKVYIPASVTDIANHAFYMCRNSTDIYYGDSKADWAFVTVGTDNSYLSNATIHFNATGLN